MAKVKSVQAKISTKLRDLILIQKAQLEKELRSMGINKPISKVVASEVLAKRIKKKLK